jgi:DNA processing protein
MTACLACATHARVLGMLAGRIQKRADTDRYPLTGLVQLTQDELFDALQVNAGYAQRVRRDARAAATEDIAERDDRGCVCVHDADYPERLHELGPQKPRVVFYTGPLTRFRTLTSGQGRQVAIVGTRRPTPQGRHFAEELGAALGRAGVPVISGLAFGIDKAAHMGACAAHGPVLAVLGSGADRASPVSNHLLYERVRETGVVVSEMPWGQSPFPWTFPARNRIMAALALMTVVVEAAGVSGSLITADFANDYGRLLGAVPGSVYSKVSEGTNRLLRDNRATVIRGAPDVLDEIYGVGGAERFYVEPPLPTDEAAVALLDAITVGRPLEEVRAGAGITPREMRTKLAQLEADGWIRSVGLGGYARTGTGGTAEPSLDAEADPT